MGVRNSCPFGRGCATAWRPVGPSERPFTPKTALWYDNGQRRITMSYRFCLGASGSGKSRELHKWVTKRAGKALDERDFSKSFLIVVPDQYTMQTQKEMVLAAGERGGILNVDVLSFGRLSHRIFEEVGADERGVLDDMGKTLLLRRLVSRCRKDLTILGSGIEKPGMIAEVKSVISEFMQYGISPEKTENLARSAAAGGQGGLAARLRDLRILYEAFLEERRDRYITGEETLDLLAEAIPESELIRESTIVFDGFTGFTPVQYRVLLALMQNAQEVIFSLDYEEDGGMPIRRVMQGEGYEEQDLFCLTRKTVAQICRMAEQNAIAHERDWYMDNAEGGKAPVRFVGNPALAHLEKALFRYPVRPYRSQKKESLPVHLFLSSNPAAEVRQMFLRIHELIEAKGYHYRDFAVVTGNLPDYEDEIRIGADRMGIPVYLDTNRAVLQNPLTETIRGGLEIGSGDYSYETVFRYLRSGLTGLAEDEVDRLENYCLRRGIASRKRWETAFDGEFEEMRTKFLAGIGPLKNLGHSTAMERTRALYAFLTGIRAGEQMQTQADRFEKAGEMAASMEYRQIYGAVIHLLDELYELLGDEKISARDFQELVEAGFEEIRLGTLPQQADRILVGDMERTRLSEVKVLFFLGVNDGSIPQGASKGGIISDLDREFLQESDALLESGGELAPTPRQQMYIQRLYLYMNMTKPRDLLYVSWVKTAGDGGSLRPSYLIGLLQQLYPGIRVELPEELPALRQLASLSDASGLLAGAMRDYADGLYLQNAEKEREFLTIYGFCAGRSRGEWNASQGALAPSREDAGRRIRRLREAAFLHYRPIPITKKTAELLYQKKVQGSVTRLETAAKCYLWQFLQYGLRLKEREEYTLEPKDTGTILHESVQCFGQLLRRKGLSWATCSGEQGRELAEEALAETAGGYHDQILYATARSSYQVKRLQRILERTVDTLQYQLQQGDFEPAFLEQSFGRDGALHYDLPGGGILVLEGRIDRVDLCRDGRKLLVKIVDYKSGNRELELSMMRAGLQLQLMLYMEAQVRFLEEKRAGTEVIPAAMLYYRFDDPMLDAKESAGILEEMERSGEAAAKDMELRCIRGRLRPKGLVGSETQILGHLDRGLSQGASSSEVIPVKLLKKGGFSASSRVISREEYQALREELREKICFLAEDILEGRTDASPVRMHKNLSVCTYCPYQNVCGFDVRIPGYEYRDIR